LALFYVNLEIFEIPRALKTASSFPVCRLRRSAAVVVAGATLGDFSLKGAGWRTLGRRRCLLRALSVPCVSRARHDPSVQIDRVEVDAHRFVCLAVTVGASAVMATMIYYLFERPVACAAVAVGQFSVLRGIRLAQAVEDSDQDGGRDRDQDRGGSANSDGTLIRVRA
jgi:hypothetical protein